MYPQCGLSASSTVPVLALAMAFVSTRLPLLPPYSETSTTLLV
jgi:hypothetical protein